MGSCHTPWRAHGQREMCCFLLTHAAESSFILSTGLSPTSSCNFFIVKTVFLYLTHEHYFILILRVCVFCLRCVSVPCACSAHGGQKKLLVPLELELQMVVSHYVGAGNGTHVSGRASSALNH